MPTTQACPKCGSALPAGVSPEMCPRCLLRQGFESSHPGLVFTGPAAQRPPPPPPELIAPFFPQLEILEVLGRGGMGVVYKARQKSLDRLVALKILAIDAKADASFAERFAREARALATLSHPSIVAVHDSGEAGGHYYLLMEYVDGTDLRRMERAGRIAPREALSIVSQVCDALQYAHDHGVVHRDIKPENILVDRRGRVKIADFGLAKLLARSGAGYALTGSHQAMGTPHYMAPEQLERPQEVDHRADIYSLGVVFYELLTGELPLGRFEPPSRKIEVDVRVDEIVLRSLEKDPPRRFQHASEVKTQVDDVSRTSEGASAGAQARGSGAGGGGGAGVGALGAHERGRRRFGRKNWHVVLVAALAGNLVLVGLFLAGQFWVEPVQRGQTITSEAFALPIFFLFLGMAAVGATVLLLTRNWREASLAAGRGPHAAPGGSRPGLWILVAFAVLLVLVPIGCVGAAALLALVSPRSGRSVTATSLVPMPSVDPRQATFPFEIRRELPSPAPPDAPEHTAFCRRVDAAMAIGARSARVTELERLTREPGLTEHEQEHLLDAIFAGGFFEENAGLLVALIEGGGLSASARERIRAELRRESPGPYRDLVEEALGGER